MGLGIFDSIISLEGATNKMRALAKMLKSRSLLLDGIFGDTSVRLHDVVRDVCRNIAKNEKYIGGNDCAWVSTSDLIEERSEFHSGLAYPNLRLLLLTENSKSEEEFKFDSVFLEVVRDLHVLWVENFTLTSLPHATQTLKNLKTLVLVLCRGLKTISVVGGELVNLKILICWSCGSLEELPPEMKRLKRLKCLEVVDCRLQSIGRGIISSLVGLEKLTILGCFDNWEAEDREERENAVLGELQALTNLTCLEIDIKDAALVAENMHISKKLERFSIRFDRNYFPPDEFSRYDKRMSLRLERETCLGHWIEMQLLRETESLSLRGSGSHDVDIGKGQNIKCLSLGNCETIKNIVTTSCDDVNATVFPASLEYMELYSLPQLEEMSISFQNLSSIVINDCPRLPNLAKLFIAGKDCLSQLEKLRIQRCEMMEQVLLWKEGDSDNNRNNSESRIISNVKFPKLKEVGLNSLPNLATFCQGIEGVEFPLLTKISIKNCPKRTSMVCSGILESKEKKLGGGNTSNADTNDDYSSHLFCQSEKVSFGNLEELEIDKNPFYGHEIPAPSSYSGLTEFRISNYHGSRSLLTSTFATNLVNLREIRISKCDEMVQVIKDDDEEPVVIHGGERKTDLFPKLEELRLGNLPKLVSFCERKRGVELPSLRKVGIYGCPIMKCFNLGPLIAPNLKDIWINDEYIGGEKELNGALQQQYSAPAQAEEEEENKEKNEGGEEAQIYRGGPVFLH